MSRTRRRTECRAATHRSKAVATDPGIGHLDAFVHRVRTNLHTSTGLYGSQAVAAGRGETDKRHLAIREGWRS